MLHVFLFVVQKYKPPSVLPNYLQWFSMFKALGKKCVCINQQKKKSGMKIVSNMVFAQKKDEILWKGFHLNCLIYSNPINFQPQKHLKSWKLMLSLKWFHKFFMPFFITPSIMRLRGRWREKVFIIICLLPFEVIMLYFTPVSVTERWDHNHWCISEFHLNPMCHVCAFTAVLKGYSGVNLIHGLIHSDIG